MKIELRLEQWQDGGIRPILFFLDSVTDDKRIECYTERDGHNEAARAYMRRCKKPSTPHEMAQCWEMLRRYTAHAIATI